jgi:uncharacterized membrane protein YjgN (DUF898 family)
MSVVPRFAARLPLPERGFGATGFSNTIIASICFAVIPMVVQHDGPRAVLWLHLVMALVLTPVILVGLRYPGHPTVVAASLGEGRSALPPVVMMLLGNFLYSVCMGSYWAYIEPAATAAGIAPAASGALVSLATIVSLGGPALAVWMGVRWGRMLPLVLGNASFGASAAATLVAPGYSSYFIALTIASALITFLPAFTGGVLIRLDPTARVANFSSATGFLLNGAGPVAGALMIEHGGMPGLAIGVALLGLGGAVMHVWPALLVDRATGAGPVLSASTPPVKASLQIPPSSR